MCGVCGVCVCVSMSELMYGGFWEHEHQSAAPGHRRQDGDDSAKRRVFGGRSKGHRFAVTLMFLSKGRNDFQQLVQCVDGLTNHWTSPDEVEEEEGKEKPVRFIKHLYYEVSWASEGGRRGCGILIELAH